MLKVERFGDTQCAGASLSIAVFDTEGRRIRTEGVRACCPLNGYRDGRAMLKEAERIGEARLAS